MEVDKYQTLGEHWSFHIKAKEIRDMPKIPVNIDNLPTEVDLLTKESCTMASAVLVRLQTPQIGMGILI